MSVLLQHVDERMDLTLPRRPTRHYLITRDVLCADDTMLVAREPDELQAHLDAVVAVGAKYGLELNAGKTVLLKIRAEGTIYGPDGEEIKCKDHAVYLGGLISTDGKPRAELTRRLGEAKGIFHNLSRVWSHANLSRTRKTRVLETCVFSKLLYGLESCTLLQADRDRVDGFQARCLRSVHKILPSFVSRVSNAEVRELAKVRPLSASLLERQLKLYGKLARCGPRSLPRAMVFECGEGSDVLPRRWMAPRCRGRPRVQWTNYMHAKALVVAGGSTDALQALL
eukprot:9474222-Pyramimonas_sp.AAC.1